MPALHIGNNICVHSPEGNCTASWKRNLLGNCRFLGEARETIRLGTQVAEASSSVHRVSLVPRTHTLSCSRPTHGTRIGVVSLLLKRLPEVFSGFSSCRSLLQRGRVTWGFTFLGSVSSLWKVFGHKFTQRNLYVN